MVRLYVYCSPNTVLLSIIRRVMSVVITRDISAPVEGRRDEFARRPSPLYAALVLTGVEDG